MVIGGVSVRAACCSMVLGGRLGTTRSSSGVVGAFPYWNSDVASSHFSPLPVEPTRVTALRFEGDVGALGIKVSALPDVETEAAFDGTPKKPSSCGTLLKSIVVSSSTSVLTIVTGLISVAVVSGIQESPTGSRSVVDCC